MSFILKILESTDVRRGELEALPWTRTMMEGQGSREDYVAFLLDLYHVVKNFCPIMAAAASRCGDDCSPLRMHLYDAMQEEQGHEQMVINDLGDFGCAPSQVLEHPPSAGALALIGVNYYLVERDHPAMVLGMTYTQEFIASCYAGLLAANMGEALGMTGSRGFSFLQPHASLDQDHVVRLHQLFGRLNNPQVQDKIVQAINLNFYLLREWVGKLAVTAEVS